MVEVEETACDFRARSNRIQNPTMALPVGFLF
jgi:hypothetical protein